MFTMKMKGRFDINAVKARAPEKNVFFRNFNFVMEKFMFLEATCNISQEI